MDVLSKSVVIVVPGHLSDKLDELVFINERIANGVEEHVTGRFSNYLEAETRAVGPTKLKVYVLGIIGREALLRIRYELIRQNELASVVVSEIGRHDRNPHPVGSLDVQFEIEALNVGAVYIALELSAMDTHPRQV